MQVKTERERVGGSLFFFALLVPKIFFRRPRTTVPPLSSCTERKAGFQKSVLWSFRVLVIFFFSLFKLPFSFILEKCEENVMVLIYVLSSVLTSVLSLVFKCKEWNGCANQSVAKWCNLSEVKVDLVFCQEEKQRTNSQVSRKIFSLTWPISVTWMWPLVFMLLFCVLFILQLSIAFIQFGNSIK